MHRRSAVFDAIKAELATISGFTAAGKVARGRTRSIPAELLPALTLSWSDQGERAELRPMSGPNGEDAYKRSLSISVIVHLRDKNPEEEFDAICALIEAKMGAKIKLDGLAIEALLDRTDLFVDPRTGLPLLAGRLVYLTDYTTLVADATAAAL